MRMIELVTAQKAQAVIETRKPLGRFVRKDNSVWVAIDNQTGDAWTEEFTSLPQALKWLSNPELTFEEVK